MKNINSDSLKTKNVLILFTFISLTFLLGFIRIECAKFSKNEINSIEKYDQQKILLSGKIFQYPSITNGKQKIIIGNLRNEKLKKDFLESGNIIIYLDRYPEYHMGDEIQFEGKLNLPEDFDGFDYKNYLYTKNIFYIEYYPQVNFIKKADEDLFVLISRYRDNASIIVKKIYSQPQAGIINAMIIGEKSDLSEMTLEMFNRTGTRHIIAISGLHMTIIGILIMFFLLAIGLNRNFAFYFAILGLGFYVILVGFPVSAIRSFVMSVLILTAIKAGRLSNAGRTIIFAGVVMLVFNPNLLRNDIGFQLSFLAVLGIIYIYPRLHKKFQKYPDYYKTKTMLLITLSAQISTFPIVIYNFGQFSIFSVFANILILPFVPLVMIGGIISIMIGFVNLMLGQIVAFPIWLIVSLQLYIISFFSGFEIGFFRFDNVGILFSVIYYLLLIGWLNFNHQKRLE